jgi:hypothetical protein
MSEALHKVAEFKGRAETVKVAAIASTTRAGTPRSISRICSP